MQTRRVLAKGQREYKALVLRLEHNRVRIPNRRCIDVLAIMLTNPYHTVYAYFDETIRLFTFHDKHKNHIDLEIIMYLESYQGKVDVSSSVVKQISKISKTDWARHN